MHNCLDCNHHFSEPNYWIVENAQGCLQKIRYCPNCVSQNIEQLDTS
jgi:hypothetical protein